MKKNYKINMIFLLTMFVLFLSFIIASAQYDRSSITNLLDNMEVEKPLNIKPDINIEKERENGEGGEDNITPFINNKNTQEDTEKEYKDSLLILGNQASKDGSNGFTKQPIFFILVITSLLTIVMVCFVKRK